ncbi:MAG: 50S ribosomal protein L13 [Chloroflexota bacterium]|jgi:large subunit ribosomal protein L13|nr:50S ribosomal protein L13 [Chloroflexota bacterium]MEC8986380.1 50S ribosomal protein L13 [Chloroflexota bacterium]|tara:strand:- start:196 stop:630 length:435 start_codon:yes stop_codon:yes gene_type:complete
MAIKQKMEQPSKTELKPAWHVVDADGKTLGRISSEIAVLLQGKHKPGYVPYLNTGDYVVVVNAEKIHVTGKKIEQKKYYRHSGYHGGLKETNLQQMLDKHPDRVIKQSVKGMLPKNVPGRRMLGRLKVYAGSDHPHQAQVNEVA